MQFIDLKTQYTHISQLVETGINNVLQHGRYIMGPEIEELEKQLAEYVNRKYCIACSSGTDALLMSLMAYNIGPGDAVFTTPFTFIATAEVISLLGATPIFVDIDENTYNISPAKLEEAINRVRNESKLIPKMIIPVNLFGLLADYSLINSIAKENELIILEDAAQSFGAKYKEQKSCSFGEISATSFFPAKPLGCYGDGGAVFTDDDEIYEKLISIRVHGQGTARYENVRIGINGRLDSIQAAILLAKLTIFSNEIELRQKVAQYYNSLLNKSVKVPFIPVDYISAWAQYSVLAENSEHRTKIINELKEKGIPTAIYYPIPLHLQKAFEELGYQKGDFAVSEAISEKIFSLPMHPYLKNEEIKNIANVIGNI